MTYLSNWPENGPRTHMSAEARAMIERHVKRVSPDRADELEGEWMASRTAWLARAAKAEAGAWSETFFPTVS